MACLVQSITSGLRSSRVIVLIHKFSEEFIVVEVTEGLEPGCQLRRFKQVDILTGYSVVGVFLFIFRARQCLVSKLKAARPGVAHRVVLCIHFDVLSGSGCLQFNY